MPLHKFHVNGINLKKDPSLKHIFQSKIGFHFSYETCLNFEKQIL